MIRNRKALAMFLPGREARAALNAQVKRVAGKKFI
jgi:hypothetical protein